MNCELNYLIKGAEINWDELERLDKESIEQTAKMMEDEPDRISKLLDEIEKSDIEQMKMLDKILEENDKNTDELLGLLDF